MENTKPSSQRKSVLTSNPSIMILAGIVALAFIIVYFIADPYIQRIVILIGITIIIVTSWNLINGFTGVFALCHVAFIGIGAYTSAVLTLPEDQKIANLHLPTWMNSVVMPFLPAILIGASVAVIIAFLVGFSLMRLTGAYVALGTEGFLVIVQVILLNWQNVTRGARTFYGVPNLTNLWWVIGWMLITIYVVWRIVNSNFGRQMKAVRDNQIAAQSLGVNVMRSRLLAFCVSAFFAGVAGALWAHFIMAFSPSAFYFMPTFYYLTMLVVGGLGSITGSVAGVFLVLILNEVLRNLEQGISLGPIYIPPVYGISQVLMAVAFAVVIIKRPSGLMGGKEVDFTHLKSKFSQRFGKRGDKEKRNI
jgi:branched-chain amino acid transport system permease protein